MSTVSNVPKNQIYVEETDEIYNLNDERLPAATLSDIGKIPSVNSNGKFSYSSPASDVSAVETLTDDVSMSDVIGSGIHTCASVLFKSAANRTVTVDAWAAYENYFVLSNTSNSLIKFTFDFQSTGAAVFAGDISYVDQSTIVIPVTAGSNSILSYKIIGTDIIAFNVQKIRIAGVPVEEEALGDEEVALVLKHNTSGNIYYINYDDVVTYAPDLSAYTIKPYVRFHRGKNGRAVAIHKTALSNRMWAVSNKYKLYCDLTADGGFTWAVTVNGKACGNTVSWTTSSTLADIVTQLNSGRHADITSDYLSFAVDDASNPTYIKITQRTYTNSTFTLSGNTGATLDDLSFYCKIGDVQQSQEHRTWQAQDVATMFPNLGFLAANTKQYAVNGYNLSYMCGGNETRYKTYYTNNGATSYKAESAIDSRMKPATFEALNGDGNATHQALYDKYNGSWYAYMEASMINLDDTHSDGIEYQSYDNGDTMTALLNSITTMDFDGTYVKAFPQAAAAYAVEDSDLGHCHLATNHEIGVFMRDEKMAKINAALTYIGGGNALANNAYYWSVAQYYSNDSWLCYGGSTGTVNGYSKYGTNGGRSLVYLS